MDSPRMVCAMLGYPTLTDRAEVADVGGMRRQAGDKRHNDRHKRDNRRKHDSDPRRVVHGTMIPEKKAVGQIPAAPWGSTRQVGRRFLHSPPVHRQDELAGCLPLCRVQEECGCLNRLQVRCRCRRFGDSQHFWAFCESAARFVSIRTLRLGRHKPKEWSLALAAARLHRDIQRLFHTRSVAAST
jgi:hypothetical protein